MNNSETLRAGAGLVVLAVLAVAPSCESFLGPRINVGADEFDSSPLEPCVPVPSTPDSITSDDLDGDGRTDVVCAGADLVVVALNADPDQSLVNAKAVPGAGPVDVADLGGGSAKEVLTRTDAGVVVVPDGAAHDAPAPYLLVPGDYVEGEYAITSEDLDGDGDIELIVAQDGTPGDTAPKVRVVSNNAAPDVLPVQATAPIVQTLAPSPAPPVPQFSGGVFIGNLNNDNDPDAVMLSGNSAYFMVGGAGVSLVPINVTTGALIPGNNLTANSAVTLQGFTSGAVLEDVNADGLDDLITVGFGAANAVRLNTGDGVLAPAQPLSIVGSTLNSPVVADIDQDKLPEIVAIAGSGQTLDTSNRVFIIDLAVDGSVIGSTSMPTVGFPSGLALIDAGDDGDLDLLVASSINLCFRLHQNRGGAFLPGQAIEYTIQQGATSVAGGDFNGDGYTDLVFSGGSNRSAMCINTANGLGTMGPLLPSNSVGFTPGPIAAVPAAPGSLNAGKDLVAWNNSVTVNRTYIGGHSLNERNEDQFRYVSIVAHSTAPAGLAVGDFDNDGIQDFAVAHDSASPGISIALQDAAGAFPSPSTPLLTATGGWNGLARFDLDSAGGDDLIMFDDDSIHVQHNNLPVGFTDVFASDPLIGTPVGVAVGDINGDGLPDAVVALDQPGSAGSVAVFLANPGFDPQQPEEAPVFNDPGFFAFDSSPTSVAVGDVNGDGRADVVVSGVGPVETTAQWCTLLLNDGAGGLLDGDEVTRHIVGRGPKQVILADLNTSLNQGAEPESNAALPELIAACASFDFQPANGINVLANSTEAPAAPACPGDADNDNDVDFNDLNLVLFSFGQPVTPGENGDVDSSGFVDFNDLNAVLFAFGVPCPA